MKHPFQWDMIRSGSRKPVFLGDTVTLVYTISEIDVERNDQLARLR